MLQLLFGWSAPKHLPCCLFRAPICLLSNIITSALFYNLDINDFDINDNLGRFNITKNTSWIIKYQLNNMLALLELRSDPSFVKSWFSESTWVNCEYSGPLYQLWNTSIDKLPPEGCFGCKESHQREVAPRRLECQPSLRAPKLRSVSSKV